MRSQDQIILFKDGNAWCAAPPNFQNYTEDPTGWGGTPEEAVTDLLKVPEFRERARKEGWPTPMFGDFVEVEIPQGAQSEAIYLHSNVEAAKRRQSFKAISGN
jgi:hypothetical protein